MRQHLWIGASLLAAAGVPVKASAARESVLSSQVLTEPVGGVAVGGERAGAGLAVLDVAGIPSVDGANSPNNVVIFLWIGPFNYVTGSGWDVVLQTLVPESRLRDVLLVVRDTNNGEFSGFGIQPGSADPVPGGPTAYSSGGIRKLANYNIPNVQALADGLIRLEFVETRDNAPGQTDALWVSGTVSLQTAFAIPNPVSPGAATLFALAGVATLTRTRRNGCEAEMA